MGNYNITHLYFNTLQPIVIGKSPLADQNTFNHYHGLMQNSISFLISFVPFDNKYVYGYYEYNPAEMGFEFISNGSDNELIINFRNIEYIKLVTHEKDRDLESTNELLGQLDLERLKKLAGIK